MTPERAAELADEAWRKFCASECWNTLDATLPIKQAILDACKEEREACAMIAEDGECDQTEYRCQTVERIAAAIRSAE